MTDSDFRAGCSSDPPYVTEQVRDALCHDSQVGELDIQVRVAGGKLFLTGTVTTDERRLAASTLAERLVPGVEVCNDITVVTPAEGPGIERLT